MGVPSGEDERRHRILHDQARSDDHLQLHHGDLHGSRLRLHSASAAGESRAQDRSPQNGDRVAAGRCRFDNFGFR